MIRVGAPRCRAPLMHPMKKNLYLLCAILGLLISWSILLSRYSAHEPLGAMFGLLFANAYTAAFTTDLLFSIFVFWIFVWNEAHRLGMKNAWLYLLCAPFLGLAFTLPLLLYFREQERMNR